MVAGVFDDTLSEIAERVSALRVSGDKGSSITESIKHHLMTTKEVAASKLEHGDAARNWLRAVTDVVTDLLDLVEDAALLPKRNKLASLFSRCDLTLPFQLRQIEERLREVVADARNLSAANGQEIEIVGRRDDKENIVNLILSKENVKGPVSVTPIQGMEGIGKTKLAKCVCDDEKVKSHFNLIIWIEDIRDESYAESVVKRMIKLATNEKNLEDKGSGVTGENPSLGEAIKGRRFLLVLDDLQNESRKEWDKLLQMLMEAATPSGAALLVTTPSAFVAEMIDSPHGTYLLGSLNDDHAWSLFEQVAGGGGGGGLTLSDSEIILVLKEMVRVCVWESL